ncbi:MAG: RNA-binding cell elongation regulator Jag/EloR [Actinomycetota bacterium]
MIEDLDDPAEVSEAAEESEEEGELDDEEPREPPPPEEVATIAGEFVSGVLAAMGLEADVATSVEEERARVDISGESLGILIGRKGQTLEALQEIARTAVQRRVRARVRLLIDVEGYRDRRRQSLIEYAQSMARRAIDRGTEIELEPMSAYERKVIHDAVSDIDGATSFSEGEEPNRKVVIRGD